MKSKFKFFAVLFLGILLPSCDNESPVSLNFKDLPTDVKNKFIEVYDTDYPKVTSMGDTLNSAPFVECYNLNPKYACDIKSRGGFIRNPFFVFKSANKKAKIPWEVLQRVFIIKDDRIYYPISKSATTQFGEPRSKLVKIDTLTFESKKLN